MGVASRLTIARLSLRVQKPFGVSRSNPVFIGDRTFASGSKTVRGEPVEPHILLMNALRPLSVSKRQGERMERKS